MITLSGLDILRGTTVIFWFMMIERQSKEVKWWQWPSISSYISHLDFLCS